MKGRIRDRIWNGLLLFTVAFALALTLSRNGGEQEAAALPLASASQLTLSPAFSPTPAETYRQERAQTRQRDRDALLALTLSRNGREPEAAALPLVPASMQTLSPAASSTPAEVFRRERALTRQRDRDALLTLAKSEDVSSETRALAENQLLETARNDEIELAAEAALIARGYPDSLCAARQGAVTVFLDKEITAADAALLLDVVREASGLAPENIRLTGY